MKFLSQQYYPIHWADTLTAFYQPQQAVGPCLLANHGYVLFPVCFKAYKKFKLLMTSGLYEVETASLSIKAHRFLSDCHFCLAAIDGDSLQELENKAALTYFDCSAHLYRLFLQHVRGILLYTHDHLAARESQGMKLTQAESIQFSIAKIVAQLETVQQSLSVISDVAALSASTNLLLSALLRLAKLGGGRSMLRGHDVELIFHLRLFQACYLENEDSHVASSLSIA